MVARSEILVELPAVTTKSWRGNFPSYSTILEKVSNSAPPAHRQGVRVVRCEHGELLLCCGSGCLALPCILLDSAHVLDSEILETLHLSIQSSRENLSCGCEGSLWGSKNVVLCSELNTSTKLLKVLICYSLLKEKTNVKLWCLCHFISKFLKPLSFDSGPF